MRSENTSEELEISQDHNSNTELSMEIGHKVFSFNHYKGKDKSDSCEYETKSLEDLVSLERKTKKI